MPLKTPPALIFSGNYILSEHYVINELESDEYAWVELTPRDIESHYRSLRLAFSGNELAAMLLSDSLGQDAVHHIHEWQQESGLEQGAVPVYTRRQH